MVITFKSRFELYVPKEGSLLLLLEYIDVVRWTNTTLDVLLERRLGDCWNVNGDRELSEPWNSFAQFTILSEKPPGGDIQKFRQHPGPIVYGQKFGRICRKALNKGKMHWAVEKPKQVNGRWWRN